MQLKSKIKKILGPSIMYYAKLVSIFLSDEKTEFIRRKKFYAQFVSPKQLVFDVGANIGNRIYPILSLGGKVVAIEPQEQCYKLLEENLGDKIQLVKKGLCEQECTRQFHLSNASTISSFSDEWIQSVKQERFKEYNWNKTIEVQMTTLDKLIETYGVPQFIKIDVEGYELEVLNGLSQPIEMISIEYTVPEQTDRIFDCINQINKHNSNILCNYSIGESMVWASKNWLTKDEFFELVKSKEFIETGFGDIYINTSH
jgi:FkbM family methyltransferase